MTDTHLLVWASAATVVSSLVAALALIAAGISPIFVVIFGTAAGLAVYFIFFLKSLSMQAGADPNETFGD
jgi:hypothetical protein